MNSESIIIQHIEKHGEYMGVIETRVRIPLVATTLLPESPTPGASSRISITPIPWFSAQIQAPGSAEFGQPDIS